jgi:hypothetical protein
MLIIGIDPDIDKSGVAIKKVGAKDDDIFLSNRWLWEIFDLLLTERETIKRVYIEAGWLNAGSLSFTQSRKRAVDVGRNHSIGQQIERFCIYYKIKHMLIRPVSSKWTHKQLITYTKLQLKQSNQEQRDAAKLIVGH